MPCFLSAILFQFTLALTGNAAGLPQARAASLVDFVDALPHSHAFAPLDANQWQAVYTAAGALYRNDTDGAQVAAAVAGYEVWSLLAAEEPLWLLYPSLAAPWGQAVLIVRPNYAMDLLLEAPHVPYDHHTDGEAVRLFEALGARALLIAGGLRCSSMEASGCRWGGNPCGDPEPRQSDVAHAVDNAFFAAHVALAADPAGSHVLQLHSNREFEVNGDIMVTTGSHAPMQPGGLLQRFIAALRADPQLDVRTCNDPNTRPNEMAMCGGANVEAQATHGAANACTDIVDISNDRFIHMEQNSQRLLAVDTWSMQIADAWRSAWRLQ